MFHFISHWSNFLSNDGKRGVVKFIIELCRARQFSRALNVGLFTPGFTYREVPWRLLSTTPDPALASMLDYLYATITENNWLHFLEIYPQFPAGSRNFTCVRQMMRESS